MISPTKAYACLVRLVAGLVLCVALGAVLPPAPEAHGVPAKSAVKPPVKKKKARRGLKARGKRRPTAKKLVEQELKAEESSVKPRYVFIGLVGLALVVLIFRHRKEQRDEAAPEKDLSGGNALSRMLHEPRAVLLSHKASVDPLTAEEAKAENDAAAKEIERLTTADLKLRIGNTDASGRVEMRRGGGDSLPGAFASHFDGMTNETMQWTAPFRIPGVTQGNVGVTNFRIVAVHEDRRIGFLPPSFSREVRRHQMALPTITRVEETAIKRPLFLAVGAATCLFYPIGTAFSCVAIGCYFAVLRPVLCVTIGATQHHQRRYYPLERADLNEAQRILSQLTGRSGEASARAGEDKKKAG